MVRVRKEKIKFDNEFLFVYYILSFHILKPLRFMLNNFYTMLLLVNTVIVLYFLWKNNNCILRKTIIYIIFINLILIFNLISYFFEKNIYFLDYIYNFILYGIIPIILFSYVKNFEKILYYFSFFSVILFLIYSIEPFYNYFISGTYMTFGFGGIMYSYIGLVLYRKVFHIKKYFVFEILSIILIFIFGNKGASMVVILFTIMLEILICIKDKKKKKIILMIFCSTTIIINIKSIIVSINNFILTKGMYSYALTTLINTFEGKKTSMDSRMILWNNAFSMIKHKPLIGNGLGYYETFEGIYTHNIFLDILVSYGIIGLTLFIILIIKSLINIMKSKNYYKKIFGIIIFNLSIPLLSFSSNIYYNWSFWILLIIGIGWGTIKDINYKLK